MTGNDHIFVFNENQNLCDAAIACLYQITLLIVYRGRSFQEFVQHSLQVTQIGRLLERANQIGQRGACGWFGWCLHWRRQPIDLATFEFRFAGYFGAGAGCDLAGSHYYCITAHQ